MAGDHSDPQLQSPCPPSPILNHGNPLRANPSASNEDPRQEETETPTHLNLLLAPPPSPLTTALHSHPSTQRFTTILIQPPNPSQDPTTAATASTTLLFPSPPPPPQRPAANPQNNNNHSLVPSVGVPTLPPIGTSSIAPLIMEEAAGK